MGWRRYLRYLRYRVVRLPGSPHTIAIGFACGAALSFTPLIGIHFALAALFAWIVGGNVLASIIGTGVGNPWTFPLIWIWIHRLGSWILGGGGSDSEAIDFSVTIFFDSFIDVFWPMLVGGVPMAVIVFPLAYYSSRYVVRTYQARRRTHLERVALRQARAAARRRRRETVRVRAAARRQRRAAAREKGTSS
jgi:hypothetical protein